MSAQGYHVRSRLADATNGLLSVSLRHKKPWTPHIRWDIEILEPRNIGNLSSRTFGYFDLRIFERPLFGTLR
jgi:hypothetical protein